MRWQHAAVSYIRFVSVGATVTLITHSAFVQGCCCFVAGGPCVLSCSVPPLFLLGCLTLRHFYSVIGLFRRGIFLFFFCFFFFFFFLSCSSSRIPFLFKTLLTEQHYTTLHTHTNIQTCTQETGSSYSSLYSSPHSQSGSREASSPRTSSSTWSSSSWGSSRD